MSDPKSLAGRPKLKSQFLGQVNTPYSIARTMVQRLFTARENKSITILDPCIGPLTFTKVIIDLGVLSPHDTMLGIEIDHEIVSALELTHGTYCDSRVDIVEGDYLFLRMEKQFDYAILNPPYVRQEWLDNKLGYQSSFYNYYNVKIPGTSNLYVYFLVKTILDLKPGGKFACILYDSWQSTRYGKWLLDFLRSHCSTVEMEAVAKQPFNGRLIDATILYGQRLSSENQTVASLANLNREIAETPFANLQGFSKLSSLFTARRGLRLKQTNFFMSNLQQRDTFGATPFVKKVALLRGLYHVPEDHQEAALLVTSEVRNEQAELELNKRLQQAQHDPENNISVLAWYSQFPETWFLHKTAPYAPLLFNYYLRNRPKHIYNPNRVYSDNFYGLTPRTHIPIYAWLAILNATSSCIEVLANSRNQGNDLAKIQLFEYRDIKIPDASICTSSEINQLSNLGLALVETPLAAEKTISQIDNFVSSVWSSQILKPSLLADLFEDVNAKAKKPKG